MDYKKKYLNALEWARQVNDGKIGFIRDEVLDVFPELKETEDDLTWLTKYIEEEAYSLSLDIRDDEDSIRLKKLQKAVAWLKKQGEQKPTDKYEPMSLDEAIEHCKEKSCGNNACALEHKQLEKWLTELKELKEQKTWSEEDEEMIDEIIDYMKPMPIFFESTKGKSGKDYTKEFIKNATKWLSRLKYRVQLQKNLIATDEEFVQAKKDAYNDALD